MKLIISLFMALLLLDLNHCKPAIKVAIVGSGNWGTSAARRIALNLLEFNATDDVPKYNSTVSMWVYEEMIDGRKLTEIINTEHTNAKYLPGIMLPPTVHACPDIVEVCAQADVLFFVVPHQFLGGVLRQLKGNIKPSAIGVSLIKGLDVGPDGPIFLSSMIHRELSLEKEVAVVMGANVASEVALDQFVEATVACRDAEVAQQVSDILDCPCFRTAYCSDVVTVELCGALKNVVAMGAGYCDALGLGSSTKAAIIRRGLQETMDYCKIVAGDEFKLDSILLSSGVADVVASSYGGRNRKCAAEFGTWLLNESATKGTHNSLKDVIDTGSDEFKDGGERIIGGEPARVFPMSNEHKDHFHRAFMCHETIKCPDRAKMLKGVWGDIEKSLLGGQKLQGLATCVEFMTCLKAKRLDEEIMPEREDRPSESFANYTLRCSAATLADRMLLKKAMDRAEARMGGVGSGTESGVGALKSGTEMDGSGTSFGVGAHCEEGDEGENEDKAGEMKDMTAKQAPAHVHKTHERRFGLFKRIHAISVYGDSPTTLFDW